MSELLKSALSEIDYALVSNKGGKEVREHYLNNAKRFINEAEKEQEIQHNENKSYKEVLQEMYDGIADLASPIGLMETYPGSQEANYAQYFIHERSEEMFNKLKLILEEAK